MITGSMRAFMRKTQDSSMQHTCMIEHYIVAGDGTVSYSAPDMDIPCGFSASGSSANGTTFDAIQVDAQLRLPLDTYVGMKDRVTILTSYGDPIEPLTFEVVKLPESFGPSAIVASLQEVYT